MSQYKLKAGLSLILLLNLVIFSQAAINDTIAQLDQKVLDKQAFPNLKENGIKSLTTLADQVRGIYNDWVQARSSAQDSYRLFFNAKRDCQGLDATLDIIGVAPAIPEDDFCFEAPINQQAYTVFFQKIQLAYLQGQTKYNQDIVNEQLGFNDDVYKELAAYGKIR